MGKTFVEQSVKKILEQMITFEKLWLVKEMITQLAVYSAIIISKKYEKMIAIDLSKQQTLDADPKAI